MCFYMIISHCILPLDLGTLGTSCTIFIINNVLWRRILVAAVSPYYSGQ